MNSQLAKLAVAFWLLITAAIVGCHKDPAMAQVTGKVMYNGKPLEFGSVTFQPAAGQPAQGDIQSDGTFALSTYRQNDGAVIGVHKIRIASFESQRPNAVKNPGEQSLGASLIPLKYTFFDQSGLSAEVKPGDNPPIVLELKGPASAER
jgi:hypothetical protein